MSVLADQDARQRAVREFTRPLVVVAGAGTGKTTTLVARVVTWLLGPGYEAALRDAPDEERAAARAVDGVLAITFTKLAAAEMDARVRERLGEVERRAPHPSLVVPGDAELAAARAQRLRLALDGPLATTIHGFAQRLLAEHPFEAGLPPDFRVDADAESAREHARRAAREDLAAAFAPGPDEDWLAQARAGVGPDALARLVANLRVEGVRSADWAHDPTTDVALAPFVAELEAAARAFAPHARVLSGIQGASAIQRAAASMLAVSAALDTDPGESVRARLTRVATIEVDEFLKKSPAWAARDFGARAVKALGGAVDGAAEDCAALARALRPLAGFDPDAFRARWTVARRLLARAEEYGRADATVTFGDLLARAADLVERDAGVRARLRRRLRQVLVDEFQDTDDVQVRLVRALALGPERDRPGLFLVGDPKQSIYGFRGADLAAYDGFVEEVLAHGGERLDLVQNFRSTPRVLDAVTRFVEPVMPAEHGVQPAFQRLVPRGAEQGPPVEVWITWDPAARPKLHETKVATARRLEARELAQALRREKARGTDWREMAVLARTRGAFVAALEHLRDLGIPAQVEGDRSYFRRREIVDATALLAALVDPGDTLSLVAFLRSGACGLPDAALEPLFAADFAADAQRLGGTDSDAATGRLARAARAIEAELAGASPPERAIPHWAAALEHALASIACLRRSLVDDPADTFVERLRTLLLPEAAEAGRWQGAHRLANLERFLRRVRAELLASGDPASVLRALRRALDERRDEREARPASDVEDAVRFLTIHGAKGLEFEAVFLLGMGGGGQRGGGQRGGERDGFDRTSGALRLCGLPSPGWAAVAEARQRRDAAERARLLYVALTRARSRLVLSASWRSLPRAQSWHTAQSFRDLAEHGLPVDFGLRAEAALAEERAEYADSGLVVRLASREPEPAARQRGERTTADRVERARRDCAHLAARALEAEPRAARLLVARVSDAADADHPVAARSARGAVRTPSGLARDEARLVGTLAHAALEHAPDWAAARARLERESARVQAAVVVRDEARAVLDAVERGPLGARFAAPAIVARELDVLVPAAADEPPLYAWTGSADLVLRDARGFVVVDFKSEPLAGRDPAVAARAHAPQLALYARGLARALGLADPPRLEVWFLRDGAAVEAAVDEVRAGQGVDRPVGPAAE